LPQLLELYRVSQRWQSLDEASHATKLRDELSCLYLQVVKVSSHYVMRGTANNACTANVAATSPPPAGVAFF
jgi:hypothetical protein